MGAAKSDCHFKNSALVAPLGYGGSCEEDIEAIAQTALDLVQSVSGGDWAKAAEDVVKLKTDIAAAEADCKKETVPVDWVDVVGVLPDGLSYDVEDAQACIHDLGDLAQSAEDIYSMVKSGQIDFGTAIKDVQEIVSDLKSAKSDCSRNMLGEFYGLGGFQECLNDVSGIVTAAEDIFSQLKSGNPDFSKLLADAEAIETDVKAAESDCNLPKQETQRLYGANECITDIEGVATAAADIISQAKSGSPDFSQIIQDAQTIASDVVAAKADCHFKKFDLYDLFNDFGYKGSCEEDIQQLAQDASDLL